MLHVRAALNMSVFLLIGKTSALTMNVAGVIKDWMLILLSVVLYGWAAAAALFAAPATASCLPFYCWSGGHGPGQPACVACDRQEKLGSPHPRTQRMRLNPKWPGERDTDYRLPPPPHLPRSPVTQTQLFGYGIAFVGVCVYNYKKVQAMKQAQTGKTPEKLDKANSMENGNSKANN